jgi:DNA polymerase III sliding clamp (beta) subunit (PCNA family)
LKIRIKIGELVEQISQAAITIDPKSVDQPNSKVYLRAANSKAGTGVLYYFSTNQLAKTFIKSEVEVLEAGELLIDPARLLGGLQGRDPDLIAQIEVKGVDTDKKIKVTIGKNNFHLQYATGAEKQSKEVEKLPFKAEALATIPSHLLNSFIKRTSFCIPSSSNGQQKFAMDVMHLKASNGVYTAQATDGNVVSVNYGAKAETDFTVPSLLIPQEALNPLQKLVGKFKDTDIELVNGDPSTPEIRELFFRMKNVLFGCTLRNGRFPNVNVLIESNKPLFEITMGREELKGALGRASNFVMEGTRSVQFLIDEEQSMKIRASSDFSNIKDEIDFEGLTDDKQAMQVTLALDYIANVVAAMTGDKIILGMSPEERKPVVVRGEDRTDEDVLLVGSTYAVSPVKPLPKPAKDE